MSEAVSEVAPETETQVTETEPDYKAEAEKWKSLSRKNEEAAKSNAAKAKEYDSYRESQKTEEQRRQEETTAAQQERDAAKNELARARAALKFKLTDEDLELLEFVPADRVEATAKSIAERLNRATDYDGGTRRTAAAPPSMNDMIRRAAGRG